MKFSKACRMVRKDFMITEENKGIIKLLNQYVTRNIQFEEAKKGRYLDKGILLWGNVGTGKTTLLKAIQKYYAKNNSIFNFHIITTWNIAYDFSVDGPKTFLRYAKDNWLFDELGTDKEEGQFYGQKENVLERLLLERYDLFCNIGYLSHFTTNLTPQELRDRYGERQYSRLCEMCNFIEAKGSDFRAFIRPTKTLLDNKEIIQPHIKYANALIARMKLLQSTGILGSFERGLFSLDDYYSLIDKAGWVQFTSEQKNELLQEQRLFLINKKIGETQNISQRDEFKAFIELYETKSRPNLTNKYDAQVLQNCKRYVFSQSLFNLMKEQDYERIILALFEKEFSDKTESF